ncbi:MAG: hypothetical protein ACR2NU_07160 [Aeoliella sp.]
MQLDQTRIVIREREFGEVLGLALQVIRAHAGWLFAAFLIGVTPCVLFNGWLLADMLEEELWGDAPAGYWFAMFCLMVMEVPFATALITLYLGRMTFSGEVGFRVIVVDFLRSLPQMFLIQGLLRAILMPILLLPYLIWPYLGELVLLERNPLLAGKKKRLTTIRRSRNMHSNSGGELFGRLLLAIMAGGVLWLALAWGTEVLIGQLTGWETTEFVRHLYIYPITLWLVVGWMAVVRFLSYLDLRIRREGWEVELLMRAEAHRLQRSSLTVNG